MTGRERKKHSGTARESFGRFWTSFLNMSGYMDPVVNVFMPTALRSITTALVLRVAAVARKCFSLQFVRSS
jgi:hypothetical protein